MIEYAFFDKDREKLQKLLEEKVGDKISIINSSLR